MENVSAPSPAAHRSIPADEGFLCPRGHLVITDQIVELLKGASRACLNCHDDGFASDDYYLVLANRFDQLLYAIKQEHPHLFPSPSEEV